MNKIPFEFDGTVPELNNALEASKIGCVVIGINSINGSMILAQKKSGGFLNVNMRSKKISRLSQSLGIGTSGLSADSRIILEKIQEISENNNFLYRENIDIEVISKIIAEEIHCIKKIPEPGPFALGSIGICVIIVGLTLNKPRLFLISPTCGANEKEISVIGNCGEEGYLSLKEGYRKNMKENDIKFLALKCIKYIMEENITVGKLEAGILSITDKKFLTLNDHELGELIKNL